MEESQSFCQSIHSPSHLRLAILTLHESQQALVRRYGGVIMLSECDEKRRCPDIARHPVVPPLWFIASLLVRFLLTANISRSVLCNRTKMLGFCGIFMDVLHPTEGQAWLTSAFRSIPFLKCAGKFLVISGDWIKGLIGYAVRKHAYVEHPN